MDLTLSNRQIVPAVVNMFQFENQTTTLNFVLDSYMWEETDLRNYIPYAVTSINGVIDMTELTATYNENTDKLTVSWTVGDYTLSEKGAVLYQIVFKENKTDGEIGEEDVNNAVWYSYKAIIINRGSVDGDNHITAKYPTLLKQWLDKMNETYSNVTEAADSAITNITIIQQELEKYATDFTNSVFYIDYGEDIPLEERMDGRLYYRWLDGEQTKGRFEDPDGRILVQESVGSGGSSLPMFAPIWSDHKYNDASYLRADTFSWHDCNIYVTGYNKLVEEYDNKKSVVETENGITYKRSPNGFKIASADQEEAIINLYSNGEKAWYYILDTKNKKFKLPREKKSDGKYLYFFVGSYEREEGEINIGEMSEVLNEVSNEVLKNNRITNCITEIPQDIKLELVEGKLTLKAGSKVYAPNGVNEFDEVMIDNDWSVTPTNYNTSEYMLCVLPDSSFQFVSLTNQQFSGNTAPTTSKTMFWYDTENNLVKYTSDTGATWTSGWSLPLATVNIQYNKGVTSINKVFNGFGYIGSTVFALPNVKGLIPNGRNEDGTLNNIEFKTEGVLLYTNESQYTGRLKVLINHHGINCWYESTTGSNCEVGYASFVSGVVSDFGLKQPFHAVDYSDGSWVAQQAMPSNKYIDLELGATNSWYTAPANGYAVFSKVASASAQSVCLKTAYLSTHSHATASGKYLEVFIPVKKDESFGVVYTAGGNTNIFRFIYAEGEK